MAELRERRHADRLCRQCKLPAKINPKTNEPMDMCEVHLAADRSRARRRASKARKAKASR